MKNKENKDMLCFAHRGASGQEPENTLRAVKRALELGAPWIEVDIHAVPGELVVIHDDTLGRTTSGKGYVASQSLEYLRSLDAGKGERIPFLREVLDLISKTGAGINIELKGRDTAVPAVSVIKEYVGKGRLTYEQVIVSSFSFEELKKARELSPELKIGLLYDKLPPDYYKAAKALRAFSLNLNFRNIDRKLVEEAHELGLMVIAFTVDRPKDIERIRRLGVDGVFTDYPELMTKSLKKQTLEKG